jgi:hypothetical protein
MEGYRSGSMNALLPLEEIGTATGQTLSSREAAK